MITQRIMDFLSTYNEEGPVQVVDTDLVRTNLQSFQEALPETKIYYAIKANPAPEILKILADNGSGFDCASIYEIEMALAAGATPDRISFGNTIKKQRDIERAAKLGVTLFAVDSHEEVNKLALVAPNARVFCRILANGEGADWPLSRKFGCTPEMAIEVLIHANQLGLFPVGVSFHVGSQMTQLNGWDNSIAEAKRIFDACAEENIILNLINLGGGFPTRYLRDIPSTQEFGDAIRESLARHFGGNIPNTIMEPGRGMVGNAGVLRTEVVLISKKSHLDNHRWVYLDVGKFGGLSETIEEAIRYPFVTPHDGGPTSPCILAGPTCDSADVLYEKRMYELPDALEIGDYVLIDCTGVYTTTYSAVAFNGFPPLKTFII